MALRVGFVGLGNIGKPMARRLVAAGLETHVLDAVQAPVDELVRDGAKPARSPRDLAERVDVIHQSLKGKEWPKPRIARRGANGSRR